MPAEPCARRQAVRRSVEVLTLVERRVRGYQVDDSEFMPRRNAKLSP